MCFILYIKTLICKLQYKCKQLSLKALAITCKISTKSAVLPFYHTVLFVLCVYLSIHIVPAISVVLSSYLPPSLTLPLTRKTRQTEAGPFRAGGWLDQREKVLQPYVNFSLPWSYRSEKFPVFSVADIIFVPQIRKCTVNLKRWKGKCFLLGRPIRQINGTDDFTNLCSLWLLWWNTTHMLFPPFLRALGSLLFEAVKTQ